MKKLILMILLTTLFIIALLFTFIIFKSSKLDASIKKPNIIVFMSDDQGFGDITYNGDDNLLTPNIDTLAADGIILNNYHAQPFCTPSRGAFLSGYYPIHSGTQHYVILAQEPRGFPLNQMLISNYLKQFGYSNHIVGKWHLGFYRKEYTPIFRGFDSHVGFWSGAEDYFDHINKELPESTPGFDFRNNTEILTNASGIFSTDYFTNEAVELINNHKVVNPFFLLLAYQNVHQRNNEPITEAPQDLLKYFPHIKDERIKYLAANLLSMDLSIGKIFKALHNNKMLNNCIIIFISDNGAPTNSGLSNYPLRGSKATMWQGSFRVPAFVWSPLFKKSGYISNELFHVTDWLPTLIEAIGEDPKILGNIDGKSQWKSLLYNSPSQRSEFLYNIDPVWNISAIRVGKWKLIQGMVFPQLSVWYESPVKLSIPKPHINNSDVELALRIMNRKPKYDILFEKKVDCGAKPAHAATNCKPNIEHCLYNLEDDPCEFRNVAHLYPNVVNELWQKLLDYNKTSVPMENQPLDPCGDPALHNGYLTNWKDTEICK